MEITEKKLMQGEEFTLQDFEGEHEAIVYFSNRSWGKYFNIHFNGAIIHSSKTYKSMKKKLDLISEEYILNIK